jgi:hypothetical protein
MDKTLLLIIKRVVNILLGFGHLSILDLGIASLGGGSIWNNHGFARTVRRMLDGKAGVDDDLIIKLVFASITVANIDILD